MESSDSGHRTTSTGQQVRLTDFNRLPREAAIDLIRPCLAVERWWVAVVDSRPYLDLESLLDVARDAAFPLTGSELEAALTYHLATRPADWLAVHPPFVNNQQPGPATASTTTRQVAGDLEQYERRFGRPFVIRTAGRSTSEVADQLHTRLSNDIDAEDKLIGNQLRQIALLHLTHQIAG